MKTGFLQSTRMDEQPHPPSILSEAPPSTRTTLRNITVMISTAAILLPIVLAAGWTLERDRQQAFQKMREEHRRRIAASQRQAQERRDLGAKDDGAGARTASTQPRKSEK